MQRVVVGSTPTLSTSFYDGEDRVGVGAVTVTLRRLDGSDLHTALPAAFDEAAGSYTVTLPAPLPAIENLDAIWTATDGGRTVSEEVQVAGGFIFELHELRAEPDLSDQAKYPTAELARQRTIVETVFENYCGVAFVPRAAVEQLHPRSGAVTLSRSHIRHVDTASGVDGTEGPFAVGAVSRTGRLTLTGALAYAIDVVTVSYVHGYDSPPPDIRDAALMYARHRLIDGANRKLSNVRSRVLDAGVELLSTPDPDRGRATGLLDVDAVLNRYRAAQPLAIA